jgi:ABC-type transport system substrate-binding protein
MLVLERNRRSSLIALAVAGVAMLSSGCASYGSAPASPDTLSVAQVAQEPDPTQADPTQAGPTGPVDPEAPATYRPVVRNGKPARHTVSVGAGRFTPTTPATYADGVKLTVDSVTRTVERGQGPGVFPGRPQTAFSLTLHNGSPQAVDASQVVVTVTYGVRPRLAQLVYTNELAADFAGMVAPGGTAKATYVFSLPPGQAKTARMIVDLDSVHVPANFTGLEGE